MNIIEELLTANDIDEVGEKIVNDVMSRESINRYGCESVILGLLAEYALNKEKNKCKPRFEDLFPCDIMQILNSEIRELEHEVIQDKRDPRRMLEEIADSAASLVGLVVNLRDNLSRSK